MDGPGFVIGNIAKGRDLWDRQYEIETIWKALGKSSVLLKAPRRFGKSSIMYKLCENPKSDYKVLFQDTEGLRDPKDFLSVLMAELLSDSIIRKKLIGAAKWLKDIVGKVEEVEAADIRLKIRNGLDKDWQEKGMELISNLAKYDGRILFILDELPVLIQNIEKKQGKSVANDFLEWFRSVRQRPELAHIRWLVGGSIGIEHILQRIDAGTKVINDFHIIRIGPFSMSDGKAYIKALLESEGDIKRVPKETVDVIMDMVGAPVPYFLQILIYESLNEMRRKGRKSLSKEIIEKAYREEVLGPASRTYFEHYFTRLKDYYDEDREHTAKRLILEVARRRDVKKDELFRLFRQTSKGRLTDEAFSHLMTDIENDFYVTYDATSNSYGFTTNILRDWWLRYYDLVEE